MQLESRNQLSIGYLTQKISWTHQTTELSLNVVTTPDEAPDFLPGRQEEKGQPL